MKREIRLNQIVIVTSIIIFLLLVFTVLLSLLWPSFWNLLLGSALLNIASSLIGVFVGVLVAIIIVERYLENQRREAQRREQLLEDFHVSSISAWLYGGLSVLIAIIMHLSFFLLYGAKKWKMIMISNNYEIKVPNNIGAFVSWLINDKDKLRPVVTKGKLDEFKREFNETPISPIKITRRDLRIVTNYMRIYSACIRDQLFLFQPFIDEHFELISKLLFFTRSLDNVTQDSMVSIELMKDIDKSPQSFLLDDKGQNLFKSLGEGAIELSELILAKYSVKSSSV